MTGMAMRRLLGWLAVPLLVAVFGVGAVVAQGAPDSYELPGPAVFPAGIAVDEGENVFYVGSTSDGTILRGDVASGEVSVLVPAGGAPFTTIGLDVDDQGRLWVAGGGSGGLRVYDSASSELLASLETPAAEATFINDVVVTPDGFAYATDSNRPIVFRASPDLTSVEPWLDLDGTAFAYVEGFNANGIAASADGSQLLVVQSNTGALYRITVASGEVIRVELSDGSGSLSVTNGDGLVLDGQRLYVVRNALQEIAVIDLSADLTEGTLAATLTSDAMNFPTTAALVDGALLVVNSQFGSLNSGDPVLPFTVVRVATP